MINSILEFAKLILPVFQIIFSISMPFLFYRVYKIHKVRLDLIIKKEEGK